jgi:hypothetical protein
MPFTPPPTLPLKGEGVVGVLDGFLGQGEVKSWENESFLSGLLEFFFSVSLSFLQIRMPKPQMLSELE